MKYFAMTVLAFGVSTTCLAANCEPYPDMLEKCQPFVCTFVHPMTGGAMKKSIVGAENGKCHTVEQMPNNGRLECRYPEASRKAVAHELRSLSKNRNKPRELSIKQKVTLSDDGSALTVRESQVAVNGKVVNEADSPMSKSLENGECVVKGYGS